LRELMEFQPDQLLGGAAAAHAVFPWLIKYLDVEDWTCLQVRPDTNAGRPQGPTQVGAAKAWFVLDATPASRVYAGLRLGADEARLRDSLARGTVADCLNSIEAQAGDCILLPGGTVHAAGAGVLIAEIAPTSGATLRLFDWGRVDALGNRHSLQTDQATAAICWHQRPVPLGRLHWGGAQHVRQELVRCPSFHLDFRRETEPFPVGGESRVEVYVILRGIGRWGGSKADEEIRTGQVWVVPAAMSRRWCQLRSPLTFLQCSLP
jgi:mannose-6-phosphate isomerase